MSREPREQHATHVYKRRATSEQESHGIRTRQPISADTSDEDLYDYQPRLPTSVRRYDLHTDQSQVIEQGNRRIVFHTQPPPTRRTPRRQSLEEDEAYKQEARPRLRLHWLVFVGLAILIMLVGWFVISWLGTWWQTTQDDWHYGRPRLFHIDQRVGHGDDAIPSHFIALNLNHQVQIIECPASDCSKAVVYQGPQMVGEGDDLAPVTLSYQDVNGDGKPDMLVHVGNQTYVFLNDNGKFRPAKPDEHLSL